MVGVGVVPRTELAEQLGLACDGGIVVDARARTSDPTVVAAGDCTVLPHPLTGEGRVRLESVNNAVSQAAAAAATVAGAPAPAPNVPWFWSNQGDLRLQIAGLSTGFDEYVVRGEPETREVLRPLLPRGPAARGRRRQLPGRLHGGAQGADPGNDYPGRPGQGPATPLKHSLTPMPALAPA